MEAVLRRHVMDAWFPRCVDEELGGFHSTFDYRWRRTGTSDRMLEFQARQARVAAKLALAYPAEGRWQEYALHGLRFLRERMWDQQHGGWYWMVAGDGRPLAGATKHAHSGAYAVQTAALVYQATGERWAMEHAEDGLAWFDRYAHDGAHGGFHSWLTRQGEVIRKRGEIPAGMPQEDPLGHDVGLKDVNVHGDWFEALLDFTANSDSARARELLVEAGRIYLERAVTRAGEVHYAFHDDWTPQPGPEWYGYGFEATHRFLTGARVLPELPEMEERAETVLRHTLRIARRRDGGFHSSGPAGLPHSVEGEDVRANARLWWVQLEGLRGLSLYAVREAEPGIYWRMLRAYWKFFVANFVDDRHGGIFSRHRDDWRPWVRTWMPRQGWAFQKGRDWKDASHETGALLASIAALRGTDTVDAVAGGS